MCMTSAAQPPPGSLSPLTDEIQIEELIRPILGYPGRLLAASKTDYRQQYPGHVVYFNAALVYKGQHVWGGDVDIDADKELLQQVANVLGTFVLFPESWSWKHTRDTFDVTEELHENGFVFRPQS